MSKTTQTNKATEGDTMKYFVIRRTSNDQVAGYVAAENGTKALNKAAEQGIINGTSHFYAEEE